MNPDEQLRFARLVTDLVACGWIDDPRIPSQSNSAQSFAAEAFRRRPAMATDNDDLALVPELASIILQYNNDPHDTDVLGTVFALLDYIYEHVL